MLWRALQLAGVEGVYFVRLLVLARLLAPEAFGLLAIAMLAVATVMRLSDVGMIPALVQKRDATPEQYDGAWTVGLMRSALVAGVLFVAAPAIAVLFEERQATTLIQALALRPLIDASASIGVARLTREMRFKPLALMYFTGAVVDLVVAVSTARALGVWALVAGALAGAVSAGAFGVMPSTPVRWVAKLLSGGFMIAFGLYLAGWWPGLQRLEQWGGVLWKRIEPLGRRLLPVDHPLKALALGLVWGWLPCGMVYAALAWSFTSGSAANGALLMAAFGLGTLPMLLAAGAAAGWLRNIVRHAWVRRGAGIFVLLFGVVVLMAPGGHQHASESTPSVPHADHR